MTRQEAREAVLRAERALHEARQRMLPIDHPSRFRNATEPLDPRLLRGLREARDRALDTEGELIASYLDGRGSVLEDLVEP